MGQLKRRVVQFGAGAIGRGFLGQLYSDSGWETVFVDVVPDVIERLNARGGYTVEIVGPGAREIEVRNVRAVDGRDARAAAEELVSADLAATAVGQSALPAVAGTLAAGISLRAERRPDSTLDVLLCENLLHAATHVRKMLASALAEDGDERARAYLAERVGLVETVVSRMIPVPKTRAEGRDPLRVAVEDYNVLPADRSAFRGPAPAITGLRPVEDFAAHEARKLYAHNCGHALAAYFGWKAGHEFVWQAVDDPEIGPRLDAGLWETGVALCRRHGFTREEHGRHLAQLLERFRNRALGDTVARVGRDPVRKLRPGDRLVGSARLALEHGIVPKVLAQGIAAAMDFRAPGDPSAAVIAEMLAEGGPERVLRDVCGLDPCDEHDRSLQDLVLEARSEATSTTATEGTETTGKAEG